MVRWLDVADVAQVTAEEGLPLEVEGLEIGLFLVDGTIVAVSNTCTHVGAPLTEGYIEGGDIMCPWHGAKFCLKTGKSHGPPAMSDLTRFETRIEANRVLLALPE